MKSNELEFHVGHYGDGTGARGIVDEVQYARKFIKRIYEICIENRVPATYYEDKVSKNQTQNINHLIAHHNADTNAIIVSGHLNSSGAITDKGLGVEVLYYDQIKLAQDVSTAISKASGLINRGAKKRTDLGVLARTYEPAILIEFGFVNSKIDVEIMDKHFEVICLEVAKVLANAIGKAIKVVKQLEEGKRMELLTSTGRAEIRALLKKARDVKIINEDIHTNEAIEKYNDVQLLSYQAAVINRTTR
ncbi:N-acetylmuramoyl-L-alanine amidase [Metasolibacillus meyeri]|uniref:N-acetylmuramoyl-L-alanine amidase n=1 Tax=Metasolibacillus meyeri TaxID=1071052 RepID=UPI000D3005F8|nr:N-acetylmuramoyl-L-alanine amidase [Metasolibacillus meyeri]